MTKRRFQSPKSIMWNEETREALFHLLRQNGYPVYSLWDAVMRPGVKVLPTQQHWEILEVTAQQMQALYPHFLLRSPDRRRYADQEYTPRAPSVIPKDFPPPAYGFRAPSQTPLHS